MNFWKNIKNRSVIAIGAVAILMLAIGVALSQVSFVQLQHLIFDVEAPQIRYAGNLSFRTLGGTSVATIDQSGNYVGAAKTDTVIFYPAITSCQASDANPSVLKPNRIAANDWALSRTAAGAETYNITCYLRAPTRTTAGKGYKLASFRIAQQITVAALTSNTFNALSTTTYVNNTANAVAGYGGTITVTMPTATQTLPYLTAATVGTAAFMNTADAMVGADFTVVMANTGAYSLYGISATWTTQD